MKKILVTGVVVAMAAGAYFVPWSKEAVAGAVQPHDLWTTQRGDLRITLTENGTMVAKESKKVSTKVRNETKIMWLIEEGAVAKEGDEVCKLDPGQLTNQVEQLQLDILQTEANLKTARTNVEIQEVENVASVRKAEVALDKAKKEIEKYTDGDAPQARRKLEIALKNTETEFVRKQKNYDDSKKLLDQNYIKKSELEDHQIAFERATVEKDGAKNDLEMFDKYTFPMTITDHQTKLSDAEREVETAKKRGESQLGEKKVNVQQVEKRLKQQQQQLKERKEDLDNMTLKAPCPGIVVYGNPHEPWYRENVKVGGSIYGGMTVLTIPDLREMQVRLQIHEADISKLKLGQKASVTTDSYPGVVLQGEVSKIATVAGGNREWGGNSDVKKFDVEVTLKTPDIQLRPGISAKAEIHIEVKEKTLYVPLQSVFSEEGVYFCHTQPTGKPVQKQQITIGSSNDNYVEVLEGLKEGDLVLLYNPLLPEAGPDPKQKKDAPPPPPPAGPAGPGGPPRGGS